MHGRMVGRKSGARGVLADVGESERPGVDDEEPEDPEPLRRRADLGACLVVDADGDELRQAGPGLVEHAQRAVAGVDQRDRALDDPLEDCGQVEIRPERQYGIEQLPEASWSRMFRRHVGQRTSRRRTLFKRHNGVVPTRIFLLDDHEIVRRGLRELLEQETDLEIVGEAGTAEEAYGRIPPIHPDVAVLDVRLPDGDGVEVCREIRSRHPDIRCLMLTSFADDEALLSAIMAGASGYLLKQVRGTDLIDAIRKVAGGESLLDPRDDGARTRTPARPG